MTAQSANPIWTRRKERSSRAALKLMAGISLAFGRDISRIVLHGVAAYFTLFSPEARRASQAYLRRALGCGADWSDHYRHVLAFASTVHDRVYLLNDRFDLFDIEVFGAEHLRAALARQPGALLLGAHLGSFEVLRAAGRALAGLKVTMLMYEDNARKINAVLEAINPALARDIVPLGRIDSMLTARARLDAGHLVGMLADRGLGGDPAIDCAFLGEPAPFPLGPFRMVAMLRRPVFLMVGLYLGGNRYRIQFEPLADFTDVPRMARDAEIRAAMQRYADRLGHYCRAAPYNWFNFFDFWHQQ